ncbi:MAG: PilN domain-containing protein [Candidatus Omnitrophota bacterium]
MSIFKKDQNFISIGLNEETIKMAHLRMSASSKEVVHIAKRDIRGISPEELPTIIKSVLNDFNVKKPLALCVIPSNVTTTKNIEIPSVDPEEIKSITNLQAGRHTPYSREEIIIDYINIGVYQKNYSKLLMVIVNRNIIKKQFTVTQEAGLSLDKVLFAPESISHFYSKVQGLSAANTPAGIVDIGSTSTDFTVCLNGKVVACRNIPLGSKQMIEEGPTGYDKFVAELKKSIESYQNEDIEKMPDSYILTDDTDQAKELQPILQKELKANVKIVPYLDNIKVNQMTKKIIRESGGESFVDVISPLLSMKDCRMDFTPEEVRMQKAIEQQGREVIKFCTFSGLILAFVCFMFLSKINFRGMTLDYLNKSHVDKRQEAQSLEQVASKTRIIKDYLNSRLIGLNVLDELYRIVPDEIYLNSVSIDEQGTITLQGISESMSRVFSLVTDLEETEMFKSVKTTSTIAKKERGKDVASFELSLKLESAKDEPESEEVPLGE